MRNNLKYWYKFLNSIIPNRRERLLSKIIENDEKLGLYDLDYDEPKLEYNQIIDEAYKHYQETHENEMFILSEEMGLTKEQFINKATNNYGFGNLFDIQINKRKLTFAEKIQWVMKYTDVELENLAITERVHHQDTPNHLVTIRYKTNEIEVYE